MHYHAFLCWCTIMASLAINVKQGRHSLQGWRTSARLITYHTQRDKLCNMSGSSPVQGVGIYQAWLATTGWRFTPETLLWSSVRINSWVCLPVMGITGHHLYAIPEWYAGGVTHRSPSHRLYEKLARSYLRWPNVDLEFEQTVRNCGSCQQVRKPPAVAPLAPWMDVAKQPLATDPYHWRRKQSLFHCHGCSFLLARDFLYPRQPQQQSPFYRNYSQNTDCQFTVSVTMVRSFIVTGLHTSWRWMVPNTYE